MRLGRFYLGECLLAVAPRLQSKTSSIPSTVADPDS